MQEREEHIKTWEKLLNSNETALTELYKQHYVALMNYSSRFFQDHQFANDCFMQLLVELWDKRNSLPEVENVRSYLLTSFRRKILNDIELRKRNETKHLQSIISEEKFELSYEDHLSRLQSDDFLKSKITKALGMLTDRQKELIHLKFFEDLDYDTIAEKCNITKRTAYNIIHDAIKILKAELYEDSNSSFQINFLLFFF